MIKKKLYRMVVENKLDIDFTQPTLKTLDRAKTDIEWLPYPVKHYLVAIDVFKQCVVDGENKSNQMAAGTILSVGLLILGQSKLFSDKETMDKDFKFAKEACSNYFNHIRNLAALHFGYKFEESENWDYNKFIEIAARLSATLGIELSISKLTEGKKKVATISSNEVTITKGSAIPEQVVDFHNTKTVTRT
jgi:hypothetical protein